MHRPRRLVPACVRLASAAFFAAAFAAPLPAMAAVLAAWDVHALPGGANSFGPSPLGASTADSHLNVVGLTRGSGVSTSGTAAARGWGGADWQSTSASAAVSGGDVVTFSVTAQTGYEVSVSGISKFDYRRSGSGAASGVLQVQVGSGAFSDVATLSYTSTSSSGASLSAIDLSGVAALQHVQAGTTITFRVVNYGGTSTSGTWYVFDTANTTAADLQLDGTVQTASNVVNGACGSANGQNLSSAPTTNLCSAGTPSAVSGSGPWTWSCAGANGGTTASCSANVSSASPFTIFHMNDVHARLTPHQWVVNQHGNVPDTFEAVGGAATLAGALMSKVGGDPTALVLDGGDISEGNPVGDMNCTRATPSDPWVCDTSSVYGNGGMTAFYELLHGRLKTVPGRPTGRGIDALVVGNHDVRDLKYIQNMEHMAGTGVPVISANVRDLNCTASHPRYPTCEHFPATTTVTVNGTKIGIIGYTTSSAQVGASLASTLTVVDCQWTGSATCNIAPYVNDLRNNQHCDVVILLTHDGHSDLVDSQTPVLADTVDAKVPEIVVSGHWHTWSETAWQPQQLNYKTIFTESSSYMKYLGELQVTGSGGYVNSTMHVLRNADYTADPDVQAFVDSLVATYNTNHPGHPVDEVVGYTNDPLELDDRMRWWSADEYPWSGNNTAGQWITDGMKWKCDQIWASSGGCDLAVEAGGGVRSDIPAGAVTYLHVYETFPWADDTYVRISMTGQDIINFLLATNMDAGFSAALDVTAFDGIPTSVKLNGQPIGLATTYKVAINNYMLAHPPSGYTWPTTANPENDPAATLVRDSLVDFMRQAHGTQATAYSVGGDRYHFNGSFSGGYRAVVTMMSDAETYNGKREPKFDKAFVRLLSATPETLSRRGQKQVPADLVNADGSINAANRLAEIELYRSYLGFKTGALKPGDIIETYGKASFFDGNPEFVDQEGVYADAQEFKIVGHDDSLAQPSAVGSISAFWNDNYKNHYVRFLAKKVGTDTVTDQYGLTIKIWDRTAYSTSGLPLPGNVGDVLEITGLPTMENYALRFRGWSAVVSALPLPAATVVNSHVDGLPAAPGAPVTVSASAAAGATFYVSPTADAQVASGNPSTNYGTSTNLYIQSSSVSSFGNERAWLRFDLSGLPTGLSLSGAALDLWNWKSAGAMLPVEVRGSTTDSWVESSITWSNQPAFGAVLDTQNLASGASNLTYSWNVGSFVAQQYSGDKLATLVVKAVSEGSTDATAPSYAFDAKEYGSNIPQLRVQAGGALASVQLYYRYSSDNANWTAWTATGAPLTAAPYQATFSFPNGNGYYQFYSRATDGNGNVEPAPLAAQAATHYVAVQAAQSISFTQPQAVGVGAPVTLSASATSGLAVSFSSQTPGVCTVSGSTVSTLAVGTCSIAADQAGNANWQPAAQVVRSFAVTLNAQTITFPAVGDHSVSASPITVTASASSGLPVTITSQTPGVCTVSGTTVQLLAAGICTLAASQGGNAAYDAAPMVVQSFAVTAVTASGDVPLPPWAGVLLAGGLLASGAAARRRARNGSSNRAQ